MQSILIKMGPSRNKEWTCCFGLHVRTCTIGIGIWHLLMNILTLGILTAIIRNPAMMQELELGYDDVASAEVLPTPLSKIDPPYAYRDHSFNYRSVDMSGFLWVFMITISSMLIYGVVKYKPSHLMPFFCLQLFDFAITTLAAAEYLCNQKPIHQLIGGTQRFPWRDEMMKLSPQLLNIVVLLVFVTAVLLKAYAIGIVWRCYKYLAMRQSNICSMIPYIIPEVYVRQDRDYNTLLPDYEEAIAQGMKHQPPPPYYQVAATNQMVSNGINGNQTVQLQATATIPAAIENANPSIPPAYEENVNHLRNLSTYQVCSTTNSTSPE